MTESASICPADNGFASCASRIWAVIACAGTGTRAVTTMPKQYRMVAGQPVISHTLAAFLAVARIVEILVVVAPGDGFLAGLAARQPGRWHSVPCGGATRAESVANGLDALQPRGAAERDWVLVHDAARCLVTSESIDRLIDACADDAVGGDRKSVV